MRALAALVTILLAWSSAFAQDAVWNAEAEGDTSVRAKLSVVLDSADERSPEQALTTLDTFRLEIVVTHDPETELQPLNVGAALGESWLVRGEPERSWARRELDEAHTSTLTARAEALAPGSLSIGPIEIFDVSGAVVVTVPAGEVEIASAASDPPTAADQEAAPARDAFGLALPIPWVVISLILIGVLLLIAALVVTLVVLVTRRRGETPDSEPVDTRPADVIAIEELESLLASGLVERREFAAFFDGLSATLRRYIGRRFGVLAPRLTTDEFLREARRSPVIEPSDSGEISAFLAKADELKFAKGEASEELADGAVGTVRRFIEKTRSRGTQNGGTP